MTLKTGNKNKGQNEQPTSLLIKPMFLFNGVTIFLFLFGDTIVFPFFSFIFSSESQVHSHCFLLFVLLILFETFLRWLVILGVCL